MHRILPILFFSMITISAHTQAAEEASTNSETADAETPSSSQWSYTGNTGPEHWSQLHQNYKVCEYGDKQSPINIRATRTLELPELKLNYVSSKLNLTNNGHTIQQAYDQGSYMILGKTRFNLMQFHFHSPSEHTFLGKYRAMVAHLVHEADNGRLAIIAMTMHMGPKPHAILQSLWDKMPTKANQTVVDNKVKFNIIDMMPWDKGYFLYSGSLSEPPCTEGVTWLVLKESIEVSPDQVNKFISMFPTNIRPLQAQNNRFINATH
ncbi:MAG: carbonic anhydrase family protein [Gammaproteobacteria bacterium]|nr:carbonic anhydrase family protein [Gammaproteobacteria bacterium]